MTSMSQDTEVTASRASRRMIHLTFPSEISGEPTVCNLVRLCDLDFTILRARITPRREGEMTLQLRGSQDACDQGVAYLKGRGISVQPVDQRIWHDNEGCMHCGMCTSLCPSTALTIDATTRRLIFDRDKCTACGMCVRVCPVKAMLFDASTEQELD